MNKGPNIRPLAVQLITGIATRINAKLMIDGIRLKAALQDFEAWKAATGLRFTVPTATDTGEIKSRERQKGNTKTATTTHRATFETYQLTVKETRETAPGHSSTSYLLFFDGSLHKNHQGGSNHRPFTFADLQAEIKSLCKALQIAPDCLKINLLEIGLNVPFISPVFPFLKKNLLTYKGHVFSQYKPDRDGKTLGFECHKPTQYRVKIYDKALQFDLPRPLMRFEIRFLKLEPLQGIKTLADLTHFDKVNGLFQLLLNSWCNVLLFDNIIEPETLTTTQQLFWKDAANSRYWEGLNNEQYRQMKKRLKRIIAEHGAGTHEKVKNDLADIWANTCKNCPELTMWQAEKLPGNDHVANCPENENCPELTMNIKGQNRETCPEPPGDTQANVSGKRACSICGKDISHKRPNAATCSKRCRNAKSNPGNHIKAKLRTLEGRGLLFDIIPYLHPKAQPFCKH